MTISIRASYENFLDAQVCFAHCLTLHAYQMLL